MGASGGINRGEIFPYISNYFSKIDTYLSGVFSGISVWFLDWKKKPDKIS